jgi:truncated hemoglobin YjbI
LYVSFQRQLKKNEDKIAQRIKWYLGAVKNYEKTYTLHPEGHASPLVFLL